MMLGVTTTNTSTSSVQALEMNEFRYLRGASWCRAIWVTATNTSTSSVQALVMDELGVPESKILWEVVRVRNGCGSSSIVVEDFKELFKVSL